MSEDSVSKDVMTLWAELKDLVESLEKDLNKSLSKGNAAAGRRVRAQLREVKKQSTNLIREMVALQKSQKE